MNVFTAIAIVLLMLIILSLASVAIIAVSNRHNEDLYIR